MLTEILCGDNLPILREMPDNSVDAIVTDPPYGLSFMGRKWDYDVPSVELWAECLRVLKPGGHLLAFAGTRTQHRMAVRIEDAGFEIRDMIAWVYGSGFNKVGYIRGKDGNHVRQGWGGSIKPALEPITLARKPLAERTIAANVLTWGTGGVNVDGCRVGVNGGTAKGSKPQGKGNGIYGAGLHGACEITRLGAGRFPANFIHDGSDEVVRLFPVTGPSKASQRGSVKIFEQGKSQWIGQSTERGHSDNGGSAARFFYCAKASRSEREAGLEGVEPRLAGCMNMRNDNHAQQNGLTYAPKSNHHPTVKPIALMRYLCRLVTPPGGIVLDPFTGSGTTGCAATLEGFGFIGIEREAEYAEIARRRVEHWRDVATEAETIVEDVQEKLFVEIG